MPKQFHECTTEQLLSMDPEELMEMMGERFRMQIPLSLESIDELKMAGALLGQCTSEYSFLANMAMMAKIRKRKLKREKADKQVIEDALSREEIFQNFADIVKSTYNAVSRMITVKQQINDELKMTDGK